MIHLSYVMLLEPSTSLELGVHSLRLVEDSRRVSSIIILIVVVEFGKFVSIFVVFSVETQR